MEILLNSFLLIMASEMGDKTQLLAFMLASRFRKPWPIFFGIALATVLNHLLAAYLGSWASGFLSPDILRYALAFCFFAFAVWLLIPDKADDQEKAPRFGPFLTSLVVFFLAEMGDKTQLATIALAARYQEYIWVTVGSTLGMLVANGLAVFFGDRLTRRLPMKFLHRLAAVLFFLFGLGILLEMQ